MNFVKRLLAVMLVVCIALSLAGCGDTTWIAQVDGDTVPSGLYIYYLVQGYGDATRALAEEDSQNYLYYYYYYTNLGYVEPTLLDVTFKDGQTVKDYIKEYALDMCKQTVVVDRLFDELGLYIFPEDKDLLESQIRNAWNNSKDSWEEIGVSESSYEKASYANYKMDRIFDAYYEIGGLNGTTEEEIEAYFSDNYARIKYMTFRFADNIEDAIDEARKTEQNDLANSYLERAKAGEAMNDLIADYNAYLEELAAEEAGTEGEEAQTDTDAETETETDEDTETETATDEYLNEYIVSKDSTAPTEKFVNYVFTACPVGEFSIIQDDTCFYLVERLDVLERDDLYDTYRDSILYDLFNSDYTKLINDKLAGYDVNENAASIKRYTVEKAFPDIDFK